jgi:hypothetical protein
VAALGDRYDNSLLKIDDLDAAAKLCEESAHRSWPRVLNALARRVNPMMAAVRAAEYGGYYWVLDRAEIVTDIMFKSRRDLLEIWPGSNAGGGRVRPGPAPVTTSLRTTLSS